MFHDVLCQSHQQSYRNSVWRNDIDTWEMCAVYEQSEPLACDWWHTEIFSHKIFHPIPVPHTHTHTLTIQHAATISTRHNYSNLFSWNQKLTWIRNGMCMWLEYYYMLQWLHISLFFGKRISIFQACTLAVRCIKYGNGVCFPSLTFTWTICWFDRFIMVKEMAVHDFGGEQRSNMYCLWWKINEHGSRTVWYNDFILRKSHGFYRRWKCSH